MLNMRCSNHSWCECQCCEEHEARAHHVHRAHSREVDGVEARLAVSEAEVEKLRDELRTLRARHAVLDDTYLRLFRDWALRGSALARLRHDLSDVLPLIRDERVGTLRVAPLWVPVVTPETEARAARVAELREVVRAGQANMYRQERGIRLRDDEEERHV